MNEFYTLGFILLALMSLWFVFDLLKSIIEILLQYLVRRQLKLKDLDPTRKKANV